MWDDDRFDLERRIRRVTNIARELSGILKVDARFYKQISPRTRRWIKSQERLDASKERLRDDEIRLQKRRKIALDKLTDGDKAILGLPIDTPTDDE